MSRRQTLSFALLASLLLGGCTRRMIIEVVGTPARPVFVLSRPTLISGVFSGLSFLRPPASADNLQVSDEVGMDWWIAADHGGGCEPSPSRRYGVVPAGWHEGPKPAPALQPGKVYTVTASGCGYHGGSVFKAVGNRVVWLDGTSDERRRVLDSMK